MASYFLFYKILKKKENIALNGALVAFLYISAVEYAAGPMGKIIRRLLNW
jgi:hypothetical protein